MIAPGPTGAELAEILAIASRTPDHGKIFPWRFVTVAEKDRGAFQALLERAHRAANPHPSRGELEAIARLAHQAPCLVVALSSPVQPSKIPLWEQQLSCGAAIMNLELAVHAMGYVASWITGWPAYSDIVREAFGGSSERIAGFIYIGTPALPLEERPRPDPATVASAWTPPVRP